MFTFQGCVDSDLVRDLNTRQSTIGYVFTIGGTTLSMVSWLQKVNSLSTIEVQYVVAIEVAKEMIWLQLLMDELGHPQRDKYLFIDSQSTIHLAKNLALISKKKHIQLQYHFIWSVLDDGQLNVEKIHRDDNLADIFAKEITRENLNFSSSSVGLLD